MAPSGARRRVSYPVSDSMVLHTSSACASAVRPNAPCGVTGRMASVIASLFSRSRPPPPASLHATTPSVGQTSGATQRCLNPGFSERIGNSRRTGLDTIVRDRDVAQQERVRERRRDWRDALACAVAANKRPISSRLAVDSRLVAALARRDPNNPHPPLAPGVAHRLAGGRRADPLPPRVLAPPPAP